MRRTNSKAVLAITFSALLMGCNADTPSPEEKSVKQRQVKSATPEEVVDRYMIATFKAAPYAASVDTYNLLTPQDQQAMPLSSYLPKGNLFDPRVTNKLKALVPQKTSYKVIKKVINERSAKFDLEVKYPIYYQIADKADPDNLKDFEEQFSFSDINTSEMSINLLQENDQWRVYMNLADKQKASELYDEALKIMDIPKYASQYDEKGAELVQAQDHLRRAQELLKKSIALHDTFLAESKLEEIEKHLLKAENYLALKDKVIVKNVEVSPGTRSRLGVFGEIKNTSDQSLKSVSITIYFLDAEGNPVSEKSYSPILVSKYNYGDSNQPLKPGYARKFGYKAENLPSDWDKKVKITVTDIETQ